MRRERLFMLFSSMIFLWVFLPAVLIGNRILSLVPFSDPEKRIRAKNLFLLVCSLVFYAWGGLYYLLIMLTSIGVNFAGGYWIAHKFTYKRTKKACLVTVIAADLALLFIFKYFNMTVVVIEKLMQGRRLHLFDMQGTGALGLPEIVLPIGISFFTFQAMSYVVDVYRGDAPVQDRIIPFALYVSFFPQLIAGPIVRYKDVASQIENREEKRSLMLLGIRRFCYGLGKKVLLANVFAETADRIFALESTQQTGLIAWLGIICYTLQIYYDFSGYSDMAIGLGRMFGFRFLENFDYPYIAKSIREFWRRWHISLSTWFREYVYIPLGGSRCSLFRTCLNLLIVFLLTGFWHGANFTFIAWGLYYGVLLVMERLFLGKLLDKNPLKFLNRIYVIFIVMIGWVFFRADTIGQALSYTAGLFRFGENGWTILSYIDGKLILMLALGLLLCGPLQQFCGAWIEKHRSNRRFQNADFVFQMLLLILSIISLVGGTYNPFIYFQF